MMHNPHSDHKHFQRVRRTVEIFISHSNQNAAEALKYQKTLIENGFDPDKVWTYENRLGIGEPLEPVIRGQIEECDFFILLMSESSKSSEWVQRELGLARTIARRDNDDLRPLVIPIKCGTETKLADLVPFPCRDFDTGEPIESYNPIADRVFDEAMPHTDDVDFLIDQMAPKLQFVGKDITDLDALVKTGVFDLYEGMFPEQERIPTDQLKQMLFQEQDASDPLVKLPRTIAGVPWPIKYRFCRETNMMVLTLRGTAVGFVIFNYNTQEKFFFGSYIAVHRCWRQGEIAKEIVSVMRERIAEEEKYKGHKGFVFEIERFDFKRVHEILNSASSARRAGRRPVFNKDEENVIRQFLRVIFYNKNGTRIFADRNYFPLDHVQPCMDLRIHPSKWSSSGADLWLMYVSPQKELDLSNVSKLWQDALNFVIVEHLGKTYARSSATRGAQYLQYTKALRDDLIRRSRKRGIDLIDLALMGSIEKDKNFHSLLKLWASLGVPISL